MITAAAAATATADLDTELSGEVPVNVQEKVETLRIIAGLFFSNAVVYTVLYLLPDDTLDRLIVWWVIGVVMLTLYVFALAAARKIYTARAIEKRRLREAERKGAQRQRHRDAINEASESSQQQHPHHQHVPRTVYYSQTQSR